MSLNLEVNEDTLDTTEMETFLHTIGRNWEDVAQDPENREYMKLVFVVVYSFLWKITKN